MDKENKKPIVKFEPGSRQPFILYLISVTIISAIIVIVCLFTSGISFSGKDKLPGDINQDGKVTAEDAALISNHLSGKNELSPEQLELADVDNNGEVNAKDSILIMQHYAQQDKDEPTTSDTTQPSTQESTSQQEPTEESTQESTTEETPEIDTEFVSSGKADNTAFLTSESNIYYVARITNKWTDADGKKMYQIDFTVKNNSDSSVYNTSADITLSGGVTVEKSWDCSVENESNVITLTTKNNGRISPNGTFNCGFIVSAESEIAINSITK